MDRASSLTRSCREGDQVHVEDLNSYLAGEDRRDARSRWQELFPAYQVLAAKLA